jgi:hypothetical protein
MMRKWLIPFIVSVVMLTGCGNQKVESREVAIQEIDEIAGTIENAEIVSKEIVKHEGKGETDEYFILVRSDGVEKKLIARSEQTYNLFHEGEIFSITYTEKGYIEIIVPVKMKL